MNRNFNEIYQEIYSNGIKEIEGLRKERNINIILLIFLILIAFGLFLFRPISNTSSSFFPYMILVIAILISLVNFIKVTIKYKSKFKESIIKKIIYLYNNKLFFNARAGINRISYIQSHFDRAFDDYYSEDLIQGEILENVLLEMSQVKTIEERQYRDEDGNIRTERVTLFEGLFGVIDFEESNLPKIDITSNNFLKKFSKNRIEMDSGEFEKDYDIFSEDKIRTMEIFTSDLIDEINKFKEATGYGIQIRILKNKIYFRISCGDVFEVPLIKSALDFSFLYKYFRIIDSPISIMVKLIENIRATEK